MKRTGAKHVKRIQTEVYILSDKSYLIYKQFI